MKLVEQDPYFQRFCDDLETIKGTVPLHKPSAGFVQKTLKRLARKPSTSQQPWRSFLLWGLVVTGVLCGVAWFLF